MDSNWVLHVIPTCEEWDGSPYQQGASLWVAAGCPTPRLNFDIIYTETASGCVALNCCTPLPHLRMPGASPRLLPCFLTHWPQTTRFQQSLQLRMPTASPGCDLYFWLTGLLIILRLTSWVLLICQSGSQELRKIFLHTGWLIYYKKNSQMEETHAGQGMGRQRRDNKPPPACHSPHSQEVTNRQLSEPCPCGVLWRLHYLDMIDQIIGHWQLIQPLVSLPSMEVRGWGWSSNPVLLVESLLTTSILRSFPKYLISINT